MSDPSPSQTTLAVPTAIRRPLRPSTVGALFLGPAFCYILLIIIYPLGFALWASFRNQRLTSPIDRFVGLETYGAALGSEIFQDALVVTAIFVVGAVVIEFLLGLALALSFFRMRRSHPVMRSLLLLPLMATPVTVGLVWKLMLNSDFGILTQVGAMAGAGKILWLSDPMLAKASIVIMDVWQWTPFMFLVLLAGLESLPPEPFESAEVDGARWHHVLTLVTVPLLRRIIAIAVVFRLMFAIATFDSVFVLTKGGPARATDLITLFIFREGFINLNVSFASAVSFLLLIAVLAVVTLFFRRSLSSAG